jgi:hypothetical protein
MSKAKLFACVALAMGSLVSSCGGDDGFSAPITGKWDKYKTITTVDNNDPETTNYQGNEIGCDKDYIEFQQAGAFRDVELYKNSDEICTEDVVTKTWVRDGDVLTIDGSEGPETFTITKLTGSELRFESTATTGGVTIKVAQLFRKK